MGFPVAYKPVTIETATHIAKATVPVWLHDQWLYDLAPHGMTLGSLLGVPLKPVVRVKMGREVIAFERQADEADTDGNENHLMRDTFRLAMHGGATAEPTWLYWLDFALYPALVSYLTTTRCDSWRWVALAVLGFLLFTFIEYWMHRIPLHQMLYHGRHERHHTHPREYVVFPIYYTPALMAGFFMVFPLSMFAGFLAGYVWFIAWHHVLHHADLNRWPAFVRRYAMWHLAHHHDETVNFGITVPFYDWLFGTHRRTM